MSQHPENWGPASRSPRALETVRCSLCGTTHPTGLMVSDGGAACSDVRWYCKDVLACTQRWTARPSSSRRRAAGAATPRPEPAPRSLTDRPAQAVSATPGDA
jgi:hypothetical protein